ncbi:MAG: hypothetical protein K2G03_00510, partial [Bacilli bacterium]|nr:hypothetical protein [Bacilli bacterium]
ATILQRLKDSSKRLTVTVKDFEEVTAGREATILRWDDPYRPRPQEGDIFIDKNGKEWKVKYYPEVNGYNIEDPINLYEGMKDSNGTELHAGYTSNGSIAPLGDGLIRAEGGQVNWGSVWSRVEDVGYGKPKTKGSKNDELSPNKFWIWDERTQEWYFNVG